MILFSGIVILILISFSLYSLTNTEFQEGIAMGCKCQDKNLKKTDEPCPEPSEESFRQAYNRMNKDYIQAKAQLLDLQKRYDTLDYRSSLYINTLSQRIQTLETYSSAAVKAMGDDLRSRFLVEYGQVPISMKIS